MRQRSATIKCDTVEEYVKQANCNMQNHLTLKHQVTSQLNNASHWYFPEDEALQDLVSKQLKAEEPLSPSRPAARARQRHSGFIDFQEYSRHKNSHRLWCSEGQPPLSSPQVEVRPFLGSP